MDVLNSAIDAMIQERVEREVQERLTIERRAIINKNCAKYRAKHKTEFNAYQREWSKRNREKKRLEKLQKSEPPDYLGDSKIDS